VRSPLVATWLAPLSLADASPALDGAAATFEPVLNAPAFGAFFFIAIVFGFLQYRVAAIGKAANRRTDALAQLRALKSQEIAAGGTDAPSAEEMERAKLAYKTALEEVEDLRTVIPGLVRIAPPPAESENRQLMEENVAAAKQFLDLDLQPPEASDEDKSGESKSLSPVLVGILLAVGLSQVALLGLFVFGPQSGNGLFDAIP
jgi:hypothetical protein